MRQCPYCGAEYDDSTAECPLDRSCLDAALLNSARVESDFRITRAGKISFIGGLVGNGAIVAICLPFLVLPRSAILGGMGWAGPGVVMVIAFCTLIAGLPTALVSFRSCSRWVSLAGLLLSVSPWPLSLLLVNLIAVLRGLN